MANADRRSSSPPRPLGRVRSRLLLASFFAITVILAIIAAKAIINDSQNPVLQQRIEEMRVRKNQNSLFAPADSSDVPAAATPDSLAPDSAAPSPSATL
ncbi:MAG: hypothetical protein SH809_08475 [Rhodothermales bacterium]|nr:hypothetical protein [Rhodothermales bacterium]